MRQIVPPVDLRRSSANFGKWVGEALSADNHCQFWVPPGFAHGFVVTSDSADFLYKTTDFRYPKFERSLLWNDPAVGVVDAKPAAAGGQVCGAQRLALELADDVAAGAGADGNEIVAALQGAFSKAFFT